MRYFIVFSFVINAVLSAHDNIGEDSFKYRVQRYFRWLKGTATKEERAQAAQTIVSDGAKAIAIIAGAGCAYCTVCWFKRRCVRSLQLKSAELELWNIVSNLNAKNECELPNIDAPHIPLTASVSVYNTDKKNLVFLLSDKVVSLDDLPILCKTIKKLQNQNMFDTIQIHKMHNETYNMVLYILQNKDGVWKEKKYKHNMTLARIESENG